MDHGSKIVLLPSGAELTITLAPFKDGKALYQAVLEEVKSLTLDPDANVDVNLWKDLFCTGFSSKKIDAALDACFKRVLYNKLRVDDNTWEPASARQDYMQSCIEVAKENLAPFVKGLSAEFLTVFQALKESPALRPEKANS
jgi:hypothetical protein